MAIKVSFLSLFAKKQPRLPMISKLVRKAKSDGNLRKLLYTLSKPEYEESFVECGFPPDDGKRAFIDHEADDKLAFYCDRYWENAGQYKYRFFSAATPEAFFKNFQAYVDCLQTLSKFEAYVKFASPHPSAQLKDLMKNEKTLQIQMIQRAWDATLRKAAKQKTEQTQRKTIGNFEAQFVPYKNKLNKDAALKLTSLIEEMSQKDILDVQAPEKPKPAFDGKKERELLKEYKNASTETTRHFARLPLIRFYYKYRHEEKYLIECERLCLEDIHALPALDEEERRNAKCIYDNTVRYRVATNDDKKQYEEAIRLGFVGNIPSFDKLIMIYYNKGEYEKALKYCDMGEQHAKAHTHRGAIESQTKPYQDKRQRIQNKIKAGA